MASLGPRRSFAAGLTFSPGSPCRSDRVGLSWNHVRYTWRGPEFEAGFPSWESLTRVPSVCGDQPVACPLRIETGPAASQTCW